MACYYPLNGYRSKLPNPSGKYSVKFNASEGDIHRPMDVPCGQCIGCRLDKSRQWAIRCMHEASLHRKNCFITLTYNPKNLPKSRSLNKKHFQNFMKRLRKRFPREIGDSIRYYHCGEYGERLSRPHYHACMFNFDLPDLEFLTTNNGSHYYTSKILEETWGKGFCMVGEVTFKSAAYVARYIIKKQTGEDAEEHYQFINEKTGQVWPLQPEYTTMSRRPGIGKKWLEKFKDDVYPHDYVVVNGSKMKVPSYYDKLFESMDPEEYEKLKTKREEYAKKPEVLRNCQLDRLRTREIVQKAKLDKLQRQYDKTGEKPK
jgi:hypothetical protein